MIHVYGAKSIDTLPVQVHYRHTVTNKWTLIGTVPANSDAFTEHILDLSPYFSAKDGLFTQYLRIRPVEYHNKPRMRVSAYGVDKTITAQATVADREKRVKAEGTPPSISPYIYTFLSEWCFIVRRSRCSKYQ